MAGCGVVEEASMQLRKMVVEKHTGSNIYRAHQVLRMHRAFLDITDSEVVQGVVACAR